MVVFGTRPEAIKLAPVVKALQERPDRFRCSVVVTAQHRKMLDQVLDAFEIVPDVDLDLMQPGQDLAGLTVRVLEATNRVFAENRPDCVLVQGDTTTTMAAALCAFYHRIPVGHVEAGLRTCNRFSPFPEEINRRLASQVADYHFAATEWARDNLLRDGFDPARVFVTGNTVIDALFMARDRIARDKIRGAPLLHWHGIDPARFEGRRVVAITGHRRENFGEGFQSICRGIRCLAAQFPDVEFVYPVHLNPNVFGPVHDLLSGAANIHLIEPLEYLPFVSLMERSTLILSDSGGVQEEAPSLGKPVLVMRDTTERPEAVEAGTVKLVGTDEELIVSEATRLLTDAAAYRAMSEASNPFGDGKSAPRIVEILERVLACAP
ncbi:UDP-N-acetylglucosamine 2-epimerase (non-hydrolyzing) [Candidatus Sumerlaeota bacterium]|nr:UDP-N-acetylglucosamine 2-epimerase (non-hydrolyzing) [Candidatus Sumerlaeota bacterium]